MSDWPEIWLRPPLVDPTAVIGRPAQWEEHRRDALIQPEIHPEARIGPLTVVDAGCVRPTRVGRSWLMSQVHVGHGAQIGDGCEVAPGTVISGEATIEDGVHVGVGALVKPFVTIGRGARIGMGAVVLGDVPRHECWAGNPARRLYKLCESPAALGGCFARVDDRATYCDDCREGLWAEVEADYAERWGGDLT